VDAQNIKNRRLMKRLEKNTYESVKSMLESPDEENVEVAMECIRNTDLKTNLVYIMFLIKETVVAKDIWFQHVPKILKTVNSITKVDPINLSYNLILDIIKDYDLANEDYQFVMDRYAKYLKKRLGNDIESIEITLKFNK
jgi:hypothetical protein